MPRPPLDSSRLTLLLQSRGAMASRDLRDALRVSPATLSRLMSQVSPALERIGSARSSRYALRRTMRNFGRQWPVYRLDETGRPHLRGELRALHGGFRFASTEPIPDWLKRAYPDGLFSGLPFFLQDLRPQGYVGRAIAREVAPRLGTPADLRLWHDDDALAYFLTDGSDLPGDLVVGDGSLERALREAEKLPQSTLADADRNREYQERAAAAQRGEWAGSSAGGEQPKFLATVRRAGGRLQSVLVKFSADDASPVSRRWADLLACEHLAANLLGARRIPCSVTELLAAGGRSFLEVSRFDRIGGAGRRGVLTLGTIEDAFLEQSPPDWVASSHRLSEAGWLLTEDARTLRWLWCFGDLIANSDMHRANASCWFDNDLPFRLTPAYDMLPMLYAPGTQGDLGERTFAPRPPLAGVSDVWSDAATAALAFWEQVSTAATISDPFQAIARRNGETVQRLIDRFV